MTEEADELATLKRQVAALEAKINAAQAPPRPPISDGEWRDQMHALAERRANNYVTLSPERRREMARACSTADLQDLVHASHRPQGPSAGGIPSSQQLTGVRAGGGAAVSGNGTGWREAAPLRPPPGTAMADRIVDEFDRRDRAELAERLAKKKVAESK
jgi:hypothetical protein